METVLTREAILAQNKLPMESVQVPEWGGVVYVKTMSGLERDAFEASHLEAKKGGNVLSNIRARLVVCTACDANGVRLFTFEDADAVGQLHGNAVDRVFDVAQRINGLRPEDIKELEKN